MTSKCILLIALLAFCLSAFAGCVSAQAPVAPACLGFNNGTHSVSLCSAGSDVTFAVNGGTPKSVFGPAGPAGPPGATGPQGPIGPAGAPGGTVSINGKTCAATFTSMTQD